MQLQALRHKRKYDTPSPARLKIQPIKRVDPEIYTNFLYVWNAKTLNEHGTIELNLRSESVPRKEPWLYYSFNVPSNSDLPYLYIMAKTSNETYYLVFRLKGLDVEGLKKILREIKSVMGMKPIRILDESEQPIKINE